MNEQFQAHPVTGRCARAAYPLVYLYDASVTLETWLRFVRRCCRSRSGRSGLMVIGDCRGIAHALFSYRVDTDLRCRKRLCIAHLIVAHLPGTRIDGVVQESAGELAASLGCHTISIAQPFGPRFGPELPVSNSIASLHGSGYRHRPGTAASQKPHTMSE